jgi:predicted nuclease of predicted toxin-antitoxin system
VRFKLDENMPRLARERLELRGWNVHDVHEEGLSSELDRSIQQACERERRILVTLDTDFADTRRYDPGRSPGVIVLRPRDQSIRAVLQCLDGAMRALATERIEATLWIVEHERLRIRDHPTGAG